MNEVYTGVKFSTIFESKNICFDQRVEKLKEWCNIFHKKNLAPPYEGGSAGNLSFRLSPNCSQFIITGTKIGLKEKLDYTHFVKVNNVDFQNNKVFVEGEREPSSESMLHFLIYSKRNDVFAIFHGHSNEILANTEKLQIAVTEQEQPYGSLALVAEAQKMIEKHDFFVLKNHGFFSLGSSMEVAGNETLKVLDKVNS